MGSGRARSFEWKAIAIPSDDASAASARWIAAAIAELRATTLRQIAQTPLAALDQVLDGVLAELGIFLESDRATLLELTDDRRGLRVRRTWSALGVSRLPQCRLEQGCCSLVGPLLRGETVSYERPEEMAPHTTQDIERLVGVGSRSSLVLPLVLGGATIGAISIGRVSCARTWPAEVVQALRSLANILALALDRSRQARQCQQQHEEQRETERLAQLGHWTHHYALGSTAGSEQLCRILDLDPRAELDLMATVKRIHPDDRAAYEHFLTVLLVGGEAEPVEVRAMRPDGELRHLRCSGEAGRDVDGALSFAHGVVHDITERKHDEQALKALNHRLVRAHEDERARIAREIHDDLGQQLAALKLQLDLLRREPQVDTAMAERLATLSRATMDVATTVRGLSHGLHPGVLERLGLRPALEALARQASSSSSPSALDVRLEPPAGPEPSSLPAELSLSLYRVAQEALANAARHSRATTVKVVLRVESSRVILSVRDDGVGMVVRGGTGAHGLGLLGMRERVHLVGGTLRIESAPARGTLIEAAVPYLGGSEQR
ncbi:MAG: ATP-binding protein [Nannocystaceae bacterium]